MKKIFSNRELRILIYFVLMAIAYYILLFKIGGVSLLDIDTTSIQDPLMYLFLSFLKLAINSSILITLVLPILLKAVLSFVCIVLQFIAVFSKKGKRALNYVSSIMNLSSSVFLLASFLFGAGKILSTYIPALCVLILDIIISIVMICRNNGKRYKNVDLDTAEL